MDLEQQNLFNTAKAMLKKSYSPYSNYKVGASILTEDNQIYGGTNIENASYSLTLCAEAAAIAQMITSVGIKQIKALLVLANHDMMCSPCGACRQRLAEFGEKDTLIHMANNNEIVKTITLEALLPYSFKDSNFKR